jgi:hypothetical protein
MCLDGDESAWELVGSTLAILEQLACHAPAESGPTRPWDLLGRMQKALAGMLAESIANESRLVARCILAT